MLQLQVVEARAHMRKNISTNVNTHGMHAHTICSAQGGSLNVLQYTPHEGHSSDLTRRRAGRPATRMVQLPSILIVDQYKTMMPSTRDCTCALATYDPKAYHHGPRV